MKKTFSAFGALALALAISGLPAAALAENGAGEGQDNAVVQAQAAGSVGATVRAGEDRQEQQAVRPDGTDANGPQGSDEEMDESQSGQELELELEDDQDQAASLGDLNQKIERRRNQLEQEAASTTPANRDIVENANPVRLAVHALLASKGLVGGIGGQVSEIAKQMNDSVATTTNAEARIQSRGFLTRLFFGGDSTAADVISEQVARNQQRISDLTSLLSGANVPADVQAVLSAQITALEDAQARLGALAEQEQKMWGLFSWRF